MVVIYLLLVEFAKTRFYRAPHVRTTTTGITRAERRERHIRRRAARFVQFPTDEPRETRPGLPKAVDPPGELGPPGRGEADVPHAVV